MPANVKRGLAMWNIRFYVIDATSIALELGLGNHTNTVLQAAFFAASGIMDSTRAIEAMKEAARKTYFAKGDAVVARNIAAIESGAVRLRRVEGKPEWASLPFDPGQDISHLPGVVRKVLIPELRPGMISGFIIAFTMSLDDFAVTFFTAGSAGLETLSTYIYADARKGGLTPELSPLMTLIFVFVLIFLLIYNIRIIKQQSKNEKNCKYPARTGHPERV